MQHTPPSPLRLLRLRTGLSGEQVARELHVTPQTIYHYEVGARRPGEEMIRKLARVYRVRRGAVRAALGGRK